MPRTACFFNISYLKPLLLSRHHHLSPYRLHRASLIEDVCRCVMDVAGGRAAAAAEEVREQMGAVAAGHQALPAATIEVRVLLVLS